MESFNLVYNRVSHLFLWAVFLLLLYLPAFSFADNPSQQSCQNNTVFNVGAGIFDITGPAAEEGMMGYAMIGQQTAGILQRLWARAFIIESPCNGKRIVFVNADLGQLFQGIKQQVVRKLQAKYGDRYSNDNVLLTATHTHSGPGGFSTYTLYNLTIFGFNRENFNTIVEGIVSAIDRAKANMAPATIKLASGQLIGISYNRSPQAYLLNPQNERDQYLSDTDTEMTLIRFDRLDGKPIGLLNWFPLHGVSMNNKNHLITGDNKGYAEYMFEKAFLSDNGPTAFVAAFAQANAGDVSPNPYGHEGGEGLAGIKAIEAAGKPQYEKAKELFDQAEEVITGSVDYKQTFVAMDKVTVLPENADGQRRYTCPAAIGISMLAGTQDGEGVGKQGVTCDTVNQTLPTLVCQLITTSCQREKPIAVETGTQKPHPWTPNILPLQLVKIGNLVIVAAPVELTTMSGRRIKKAVASHLPNQTHVVLSALANAYAGYVATHHEYPLQRYEAASTHFGPWELAALQQEFGKLAQALTEGRTVPVGPIPEDLTPIQINAQPGVILDDKPVAKKFGDLYQDVKAQYRPGDRVQVIFWGGHPKNNFHTQHTFLSVQQLVNGQWVSIRNDNDWDTEFHWQRRGAAYSWITIIWRIPSSMPAGLYRVVHYGDWKSGWSGHIFPYTGFSSAFNVS